MLNKKFIECTETEFKINLEEGKPRSWLKSVSAFANGTGGTIYFGVDNSGNPVGISNPTKVSEKITELIDARISPKPLYKLTLLSENEIYLMVLEVNGGSNTPYYYSIDGIKEAYIRNGTSTVIAPDYILNELILKGSGQTYDSIVTQHKKNDYSFTYFEASFFEKTNKRITPADYYSFGFVNDEGYLTNAGCLLADQAIIRQSRIFCTHWNGLDKTAKFEALDDKEFSGSILKLLDLAIDFCTSNFKKAWYKTDKGRKEMPEYSIIAIREVLINALMHRDYNELGSEISIDFFADRLEITSPGGMYDGTLLTGSVPDVVKSKRRNPIIADIFSRMELMDRRGSGLNKIIDATDSLFLDNAPHAHFHSTHSFFQVILDNANYNQPLIVRDNTCNNLKPIQTKILNLIKDNNAITYRELSIKLGVFETTITRNIRKLKELKVIARSGSDRDGFWIVLID